MDASLAFYRDLLELAVVVDEELAGEALDRVVGLTGARLRLVELAVGDGRLLELVEYRDPPGRELPPGASPADVGAHHVALLVDDLNAAHRRLSAAGVRFTCPPQEIAVGLFEGTWTTYCFDPDGLVVELWQPPRGADHHEPITTGGEKA
jgi:catechol 2,3-dioxygenase-like lactoylglutathione lyase family enzyme